MTPTAPLEVSGTVSATHFVGDGSGLTGIGGGSGDNITSGTTNVTVNSATSTISFTTNGSVANYINSSGRLVTTGISVTTNQLSATTGYFSGNLGVKVNSPLSTLHVSDTLTATGAGPVTDYTSTYFGGTMYSRPGALYSVTSAPTGATSGWSTNSALAGTMNIPSSNANAVREAAGLEGLLTNASTASGNFNNGVTGAAGVKGRVFNNGNMAYGVGALGEIESDAGTVSELHGGTFTSEVLGGTVQNTLMGLWGTTYAQSATTPSMYGAYLGSNAGSGSNITSNMFGAYIWTYMGGGTVTNRYTLYLDTFNSGTPTGNDFGLYQNGAAQKNLFTGTLGVGGVTPTVALQVSGGLIVSTTGQTSSPSLYVSTSGSVGIGTTNPTVWSIPRNFAG